MLKQLFVVIALLILCNSVYAQENNSTFTSANGYSYFVITPEGWVADYHTEYQKWFRVFYPKGSTYRNAAVWIYALAAQKGEKRPTLASLMGEDTEYKEKSEKLEVKEDAAITTAKDLQGKVRRAEIRYYTSEQRKIFEANAYIEEEKLFVNFVLQSRDKKAFQAALPAFKELIGSYSFLTDKLVQ